MGNRVAVSVPSQILPIEFYLKELADIQVKTSLGNTCFLKVACCSSPEGLVVVKVFVNNENTVKLEPYRALLLRVHDHLDNAAPNCLMYAAVKITDTAGVMLRQHVDKSLHERISTRPFLTHLEKTWLAFQLLCALRQAHQAQVYHGDIKSENVLVTASGWLQLTDFAPYKPVTLPDNDPSDFTYFFDTSRRRTCYIAPERFRRSDGEGGVRETSPEGEGGEKEASPTHHSSLHNLTPAMDIFSAGCVLVELFTEGYVPFDLTQLLAYRKQLYHPQKLLDKIQHTHVQVLWWCSTPTCRCCGGAAHPRAGVLWWCSTPTCRCFVVVQHTHVQVLWWCSTPTCRCCGGATHPRAGAVNAVNCVQALVLSMLSRDPCQRRSAGDYLEEQRGLAFPDYFYSFLWPYCKHFAGHPKRPPDLTIKQISESLNDILLNICGEKIAELDKKYLARCSARPASIPHRDHEATDFPSYRLNINSLRCGSDDEDCVLNERCESLILVLPIITAAFRSLTPLMYHVLNMRVIASFDSTVPPSISKLLVLIRIE
ncbi:Protein kinase domain [Trinorchestia longiramus]|nr:Protein kinase domain [Trinorchestia longiramus]